MPYFSPLTRKTSMGLWVIFLVGLILSSAPQSIAAEIQFPQLTGRVVDKANLLTSQQTRELSALAQAQETKHSHQFVIVTVNSLQGQTIEDYGYQLLRHWGIGQKDRNNGVLLIVAPNERKTRIEVGYGLEGALTDALSKQIIETIILPRFRSNDMSGGIELGAKAILKVLDGEKLPPLQKSNEIDWGLIIFTFLIFGLVGLIIRAHLRNQEKNFQIYWESSDGTLYSGSRGAGYRTGGFSGGGFGGGGFSGGGGSGGGGGASGGW